MASLSIVLMALVTFLPRLMGLWFSGQRLPPFFLRFLHYVPIAVFAALIVPSVPSGEDTTMRAFSALLAALIFWRLRSLSLGLLVGMVALWLLKAIF